MPTTEATLELIAYAFVMSITPGPNNLLLLSSGLNFGLRQTQSQMAGILSGAVLQIWLVGGGLGILFAMEPRLQLVLKLSGSLYMLWLAIHLWRAGNFRSVHSAKPIGYLQAVTFQFINPKAWLMATTLIAAFVPAGPNFPQRLGLASMAFAATALPCITLWAAGGAGLGTWLRNGSRVRTVNRLMAVLAGFTAILFWI